MNRGAFITFEGPEKSGKSTQARLLSRYLAQCGHETLFVREPGSTKLGEKIRKLLLDKKNTEMSVLTEMLLYMAARAQLIDEVIRPALEKGHIVLCDRFLDSTIAYQGFGCGLDIRAIKTIGRTVAGNVRPDLTLLLDFWKSADHLRNHKRPDRIEMRSEAFHCKVKEGYFKLAKQDPGRIKIVKVEKDLNETQDKIRKVVDSCLLRIVSARRPRTRF